MKFEAENDLLEVKTSSFKVRNSRKYKKSFRWQGLDMIFEKKKLFWGNHCHCVSLFILFILLFSATLSYCLPRLIPADVNTIVVRCAFV